MTTCDATTFIRHPSYIQSVKVLGVTISDSLSVAEHVNKVITSSVQSVHAFRLLRAHGMTHESLQIVYAASAWWGYASAADRQRLEAVLRAPSELRSAQTTN